MLDIAKQQTEATVIQKTICKKAFPLFRHPVHDRIAATCIT